jgi:hypothetical protein
MHKVRTIRMWFFVAAVGLLCFCGKADLSLGKTIFFDNFTDGNARDGMPLTWDGGSKVEAGDLLLSGTNFVQSIPRRIALGDVSIRTQLRLVDGGYIGVLARSGRTVEGVCNYFGYIDARSTGVGLGCLDTATGTASIDFNAKQEDVMLQLDVIGDTYSVWAWRPDESMPTDPLASRVDERLKEGGVSVWVASEDFFTTGRGPARALFRYVHVADTHLTDASSLLQAGDADQDLDFDQLDLVRVQQAGKYLTGQLATWGEGDWNGAPGGSPENPPVGDGLFNQLDIVAAQQAGIYLTGWYAAIKQNGQQADAQTSVRYDVRTGELAVDAPVDKELTSINIDSASGIFTDQPAQNLGGSFDNDSDNNIFKATLGSSFGSLSFGNVAQAGLSEQFVLGDLTVVGSLAGGGPLGDVDLIYVPEPTGALLASLALVTFAFLARRVALTATASA